MAAGEVHEISHRLGGLEAEVEGLKARTEEIDGKLDKVLVKLNQAEGAGKVAGWLAKAGWGGMGAGAAALAAKAAGLFR